jgi:hypothetical protein
LGGARNVLVHDNGRSVRGHDEVKLRNAVPSSLGSYATALYGFEDTLC